MTRRLFGTDGVRGVFGVPPIDRQTVRAVGFCFARACRAAAPQSDSPPFLVVGGDTRASRVEITAWLGSALRAAGCDVRSAGVVPTPGLVHLVTELGAAGGIVVSASHNPHTDNGLKLIGRDGFKIDPEAEREIERQVAAGLSGASVSAADGRSGRLSASRDAAAEAPQPADRPGSVDGQCQPMEVREAPGAVDSLADVVDEPGLGELYLHRLFAILPAERPLAGLKIAVDAANGAASSHAEPLFTGLGARCRVTCARPDGRNINHGCGSTFSDRIAAFTRDTGSDLGVALDGDGDRVLLADHRGRILDGDALLHVWASHLAAAGELPGRRVVATTLSNVGLEQALETVDVRVLRCGVGDREVVETMRREGIRLGGEQSGHLVDLEHGTTGDGLLTGAVIACIVAESGRSLADIAAGFHRLPQTLRNVRVREKRPLDTVRGLQGAVAAAELDLGGAGRVLLRYSGTEPLARVMIEGPDQQRIDALCGRIVAVLEKELGC